MTGNTDITQPNGVYENLGSLDQSLLTGRSFWLAIPPEIRTFDHETESPRYGLLLGSDLPLDSRASF